jgi:hypothetical protein
MEAKSLRPYFVVIGLLALTALLLAMTVDVRVSDEAGIRILLPDRVGEWQGREIRYCLSAGCQRDFVVDKLDDPNVCPACGGPLDVMSKGEKDLLPGDTVLLRKRYVNAAGEQVFVTIVMSGKERVSIHRPQICLVGQGNEIVRQFTVDVPIEGRKPLQVMTLEMLRRGNLPDGRPFEQPTYYGYWFVGKGRETPHHVQRMIWMATDRIFHNVSHRWAYISVGGARDKESDDYQKQISSFVHDLYPELLPPST